MPFPNVNSEFETLFEPTRIWLFGKPFKSIRYEPEEMWGLKQGSEGAENTDPVKPEELVPSKNASTPRKTSKWTQDFEALVPASEREPETRPIPSPEEVEAAKERLCKEPDDYHANEFKNYVHDPKKYGENGREPQLPMPPRRIERKLRQDDQRFARIYSFSFEGHYYRLPRPLLFLLSGPGRRPDEDPKAADFWDRHVSFATKFSGTAAQDWQFSDDIRVWAVDRKDLAVCLDVEIANYQELLLESIIAARRGTSSRGDMVSRGDVVARGDGGTASRSAGAGAFRGDMIGPHQNW
jgi:hypothetical protein